MAERKRSSILIYLLVFLFAVTAVLAYSPHSMGAQAATIDYSKYKIVIDPGHVYENGAVDTGVKATDGTLESNLNLQISSRIIAKLNTLGFDYYATLPVPGLDKSRVLLQNKIPNITQADRAAAANTAGASLLLSVHMNSYTDSAASGTGVAYDSTQANTAKSKTLADNIYSSVGSLAFAKGNRTAGVYTISPVPTVLHNSTAPAVQLEAGFMSNASDLAWLKNTAQQDQYADKVVAGIVSYLGGGSGGGTGPDRTVPTAKSVTTSATSSYSPKFKITANGVDDLSGVNSVQYRIYPKGNMKSTKTVNAVDQGGGKWVKTINVAQLFGDKSATYTVDVYATDNAQNTGKVGTINVKYMADKKAPVMKSMKVTKKGVNYTGTASDVTDVSGVKSVKFVVYPKGQPALKRSITAKKVAANTYKKTFNMKSWFGTRAGTYVVEAWGLDKRGNEGRMGSKSVTYNG